MFTKHACEEVITTYFRLSPDAFQVLKQLLVYSKPVNKPLAMHITFAAGEFGGVCLKQVAESNRDYLFEAECLFDLLALMKNSTELAGDLFLHMMTQFTAMKEALMISNENNESVLYTEEEAHDSTVEKYVYLFFNKC